MNLSPELLKILMDGQFAPASYMNQMGKQSDSFGVNVANGLSDKGYYDAVSNRNYAPVYSQSGNPENGEMSRSLVGYNSYDPKADVAGGMNYAFDTKGNQTGQFKSNDFVTMEPGEMLTLGILAAMTGGAAMSGMGVIGAGAGAGGAGGGAFVPGAIDLAGTGISTTGGGLYSGGLSGLAGMSGADVAALSSGAGLGSGVTPGIFNAAMDSQLANSAIGGDALSGYTAAGTGGVTGSPIAGAGGSSGSFMDKITSALGGGGGGGGTGSLGSLGSLGGLASTVLGGAMGAKGNEASTSSKLDPRVQQGRDNLLGYTDNLLNQQMAQGGLNDWQRQGHQMQYNVMTDPRIMQGYTGMQNMGQGLLGRGVAKNPYGG